MYGHILLSTDGSDVARKGVEHGMALAKALNAKVTVLTVTEHLLVYPRSGHAGWIPPQEMFDSFDAACKERAGEVLDEARAMAEQTGLSVELLHVPNAYPAPAIIETAKSQGCDLIVMASHTGFCTKSASTRTQTSWDWRPLAPYWQRPHYPRSWLIAVSMTGNATRKPSCSP